MRPRPWTWWGRGLGLALALSATPASAQGLYKVCYAEMGVALLMEVSDGATRAAAESFVEAWMDANAARLDEGFSTVSAALLDALNVDRALHGAAYSRAMLSWRDCLRRVYARD